MQKVILYGIVFGLLVFLLKYIEYRFVIMDHSVEIYAGLIALFFTLTGIWAGKKLLKPQIVVKEVQVPAAPLEFIPDERLTEKLGLSKRELEVLGLMSKGYSNQEIADHLFVSVNTVKTHSSNLFLKMEVSRRTQAISKAKEWKLIA